MKNRSRHHHHHHIRNTSIATSKQIESHRTPVGDMDQKSSVNYTTTGSDENSFNSSYNNMSSDIIQRPLSAADGVSGDGKRMGMDVDYSQHNQENYYDIESVINTLTNNAHRSAAEGEITSNITMTDNLNYYNYPLVMDNNIGVVGNQQQLASNNHYFYGPIVVNSASSAEYTNNNYPHPHIHHHPHHPLDGGLYMHHNHHNNNNYQRHSDNWMPQRIPSNINYYNTPQQPLNTTATTTTTNNSSTRFNYDKPINCFISNSDMLQFESKLQLIESNGSSPYYTNNKNENTPYYTNNTNNSMMMLDNKKCIEKQSYAHTNVTTNNTSSSVGSVGVGNLDMTNGNSSGKSNEYHHPLSTSNINNIILEQSFSVPGVSSDVIAGGSGAGDAGGNGLTAHHDEHHNKNNKSNTLNNLSTECAHSQDYSQHKSPLHLSTSVTTINNNNSSHYISSIIGMNADDHNNTKRSSNNVMTTSSPVNTAKMTSINSTTNSSSTTTNNANNNNNSCEFYTNTDEHTMIQNTNEIGCGGEDTCTTTVDYNTNGSNNSSSSGAISNNTLNINEQITPSSPPPPIMSSSASTIISYDNDSQQPLNSTIVYGGDTMTPTKMPNDDATTADDTKTSLNTCSSPTTKDPKTYINVENIINKILVPTSYDSSYSDIIDMDNQFYRLNLDNINQNYFHNTTTSSFYSNLSDIKDISSGVGSSAHNKPETNLMSTSFSQNNNSTLIQSSTINTPTNVGDITGGGSLSNPLRSCITNTNSSYGLHPNNPGNNTSSNTSSNNPTPTTGGGGGGGGPNINRHFSASQRKLKYASAPNTNLTSRQLHVIIPPSAQMSQQQQQPASHSSNIGPHPMMLSNKGSSTNSSGVLGIQSSSTNNLQTSTFIPNTPNLINPNNYGVAINDIVVGTSGGSAAVAVASCSGGSGDPSTSTNINNNVDIKNNMLDKVNKLEAFRSNIASFSILALKDIQGWIVDFSRDQHGSRFIQQKMEKSANGVDRDIVFKEIISSDSVLYTLMTDVFGNYVVQKMLEYGNDQQKRLIANHLKGRVLVLTTQMYGCRVIQKAIECIPKDIQAELIHELDSHVLECVKDQNGNHVIQKCIEHVPANNLDFIINEFNGRVYELSSHPYGCRVIQRLMEHCAAIQTQTLMLEIFDNLPSLVKDQYGNYVIQHILDHKKHFDFPYRIIQYVFENIFTLSAHKFASNVVEKCVQFSTMAQKEELIRFILRNSDGGCNDNLYMMMKDPFANYVVQKIVDSVSGDIRKQLLLKMKPYFINLKKLTYGKHMINKVDRWLKETETMTSFIKCEEEFPSLNSTRPSS